MSTRTRRSRIPDVLQTRHESVFIHQTRSNVRLSEIIGPLSYALDLADGFAPGHALRACWIGMHIGQRLGLDAEKLSNLYYTILLKDIGGSAAAGRLCSVFANDDFKVKSQYRFVYDQSAVETLVFLFRNVAPDAPLFPRLVRFAYVFFRGKKIRRELHQVRCRRGIALAARMGFSFEVADGIRCLDEHYNGRGKKIPLFSRIALVSQFFEIYHCAAGVERALRKVRRRSRMWFDPELVDVLETLTADPAFYEPLRSPDILHLVHNLEPKGTPHASEALNDHQIDETARAFADIIDAKSQFNKGHALRVAHYAQIMAKQLGLSEDDVKFLYRAGLLHDIGTLGISNTILDKPGRLDPQQWTSVKLHPIVSEELLKRVDAFSELGFLAGAHHERLDGKGYPRGLKGDDIPPHARILALAGAFDAISYPRAYHPTRTVQEALAILEEERDLTVDGACLDALRKALNNDLASIALLETV